MNKNTSQGQRNTDLRKHLQYQKDVLRWGTDGMISGCIWLGFNSTKNICILPISWGYGDHNTSLNHEKEELMWSRLVKTNIYIIYIYNIYIYFIYIFTLHKPNLNNSQGGREKEEGKVICLWFLTSFWALLIMALCLEFKAENLTERQKTIREERESTLLNHWGSHKCCQIKNSLFWDHLKTAFRTWKFLQSLLFLISLWILLLFLPLL